MEEVNKAEELNSPSPQTPPIVKPAEHKSKKWLIVLGILVGFVLVGGSAFALGLSYQNKAQPMESERTSVYASPSPTVDPSSYEYSNTFYLQDFIAEKCKKITGTQDFYYGIAPEDFPFTYNSSLANLKNIISDDFMCGSGYEPGKNNGYLPFDDSSTLNVHDKDSLELGHDGAPFLGEYGKIIEDKNNIKLGIYLNYSHGGDNIIEDMPVYGRGIRTFPNNGKPYYASYTVVLIPANDPRVIKILSRYSKSFKQETGRHALNGEDYKKAENEVVNSIFKDVNNLSNPEKENINKLRTVLESIKLKSEIN